MSNEYVESVTTQFEHYKKLGEKTMAQLSDKQLFWQYNEESNSIAIIVKHLWGNMRSRWTDFLTTDGEKEWRNRDTEFETDMQSREALLGRWNEGWDYLFNALRPLTAADLTREIYIRNQPHTVMDAINRQLAHYAYHVGQMVYIGKMRCNEQWMSLSIPKGKSTSYNAEKFSQTTRKPQVPDDFLNEEKV